MSHHSAPYNEADIRRDAHGASLIPVQLTWSRRADAIRARPASCYTRRAT